MSNFIDLTHLFEKDSSRFFGLPEPKISSFLSHSESKEHYNGKASFEISQVNFVTSIGTYIDSPKHRFLDGLDISKLDLSSLITQGVLIDLSNKSQRQGINQNDLKQKLKDIDLNGKALLIYTNWNRYWKKETYSEGPYLDKSCTDFIINSGVKMVGIDTLNIDNYKDDYRPIHTNLLKSNCLIIENLTNLNKLKNINFIFYAIPIKIKNATSFPVRAFAQEV